ncbi:MAG: PadR family transcriptional regulator [Micromonosporaceae bacterium]
MTDKIRVTATVAKVLAVFLTDPAAERYGWELMQATGHPSGTLYPILTRLEDAGWVEATWEQVDPGTTRPARRYYRLTASGVESARLELAALTRQLGVAGSAATKVRPA